MIQELFKVRRIGVLSIGVQIVLLILTYLGVVGFYYSTWLQDLTFYGMNPSWHLILVPFYEEFIFRGFLLGALYDRYGRVVAIVLSSFLFGIWHLKNFAVLDAVTLVQQVLYAGFVIGPFLGWLALRYRTLWPGVMVHALNNVVLVPLSWMIFNSL